MPLLSLQTSAKIAALSTVVALSLAANAVGAQSSRVADSANRPLPVDPAVTTGTLPNGLHYSIRANREPQKRAELRLVIRAGSVLEDNDQRGVAHVLEHM